MQTHSYASWGRNCDQISVLYMHPLQVQKALPWTWINGPIQLNCKLNLNFLYSSERRLVTKFQANICIQNKKMSWGRNCDQIWKKDWQQFLTWNLCMSSPWFFVIHKLKIKKYTDIFVKTLRNYRKI